MLNKLRECIDKYAMVQPGDSVICAVSGGADSMALLMAMYLLREKLQIRLSAAHFNHGLRGEESDGDEAFVREFCDRLEIPFFCGHGQVVLQVCFVVLVEVRFEVLNTDQEARHVQRVEKAQLPVVVHAVVPLTGGNTPPA